MQFRRRFLLLAILVFVAPMTAASAGELGQDFPIFDRPICEPPISVCNAQSAGDNTLSTVFPERECPPGYTCACVPSCLECDDCAAEVCLRDRVAQCETACDARWDWAASKGSASPASRRSSAATHRSVRSASSVKVVTAA